MPEASQVLPKPSPHFCQEAKLESGAVKQESHPSQLAGAETGAGGRIRDTHATGMGSIMGASTAGYCVGNLLVEGYDAPWEDASERYPDSLAPPLQVLELFELCKDCPHNLSMLCLYFPCISGFLSCRLVCASVKMQWSK